MTDDAHEISTRIAKLEQEGAELKQRLARVFTVLDISTAKEPFLRLMISLDATEPQESDVYQHLRRSGMNLRDLHEERGV